MNINRAIYTSAGDDTWDYTTTFCCTISTNGCINKQIVWVGDERRWQTTGGSVLFWRLDGQMDGQMDGWVNGWLDEVGVADWGWGCGRGRLGGWKEGAWAKTLK